MSVYMIVEVEITDGAAYAEYMEKVPATVGRFGGRYLVRGGMVTPLGGGWEPERVVVVEFPSAEEMGRWASSPEYQAIAPLRTNSTKTRAILLEGAEE